MSTRRLAPWSAALFFLLGLGPATFASPIGTPQNTPVKVVATLPFLREFAEAVGHDHVQVTTLITGFESEHSYSPKPSHLKAIGEARVLIEVGLGLEVWVGGLIKNAGNQDVRVVTTSRGVPVIAASDDASSGLGNPHIWLDPENAKIMTRHIADSFIEVDPAHKGDYENNRDLYLHRLDETEKELQARVAQLADRRIITHHAAWPYFARRFGFQIEGTIVQQSGAEPTAAHLARLARRIKTEHIKVIVSEPQLNQKIAQALAGDTGARIVVLSPLPGTIMGTDTYVALLTYDITSLVKALQS